MKQLANAWVLYSADNDSNLPAPYRNFQNEEQKWVPEWSGLTGGEATEIGNGNSPAWLDLPVRNDGNTAPNQSVAHSPLTRGLKETTRDWKCPSDLSVGASPRINNGSLLPRVRTYSMSIWMGPGGGWSSSGPGWKVFQKVEDFAQRSPAETFTILDEREDSINDASFVVDMKPRGAERTQRIVDFPSMYHAVGGNIAYADGHVEHRTWTDYRTMPSLNTGREMNVNVPSPGNADVQWLQERTTYKVD